MDADVLVEEEQQRYNIIIQVRCGSVLLATLKGKAEVVVEDGGF